LRLNLDYRVMAREGEVVSGDAVSVRQTPSGCMILLIDGLGHGPPAAEASQAAIDCLHALSVDASVESAIHSIDRALIGTRGAAALLLVQRVDKLMGVTVGNVELRVEPKRLPIVPTPGIVGRGLRKLRVFEGRLELGMWLVAFSDGIAGRFSVPALAHLSTSQACATIMQGCRRPHDDASVLVAQVE
jgi:negative regulator of sigma-B (phosphoserine phosphatase)